MGPALLQAEAVYTALFLYQLTRFAGLVLPKSSTRPTLIQTAKDVLT